jgi:hypothetical protein
MTRSVARLAVLLVLSAPPALAFAGQQHPHESARSTESGGRHHPAGPPPHATTAAPTMPGLSSAQVLSGPLPMFPAPPASPFSAAPSTYLPHKGIAPLLRPRHSIVIGGLTLSDDTAIDTPPAAGHADTPLIDAPVAAQPPDEQPPDAHRPGAQGPDAAPHAAPTNPVPVTLYVIPGCYAGDRPPVDGILPAGCDVGKMRIMRIR